MKPAYFIRTIVLTISILVAISSVYVIFTTAENPEKPSEGPGDGNPSYAQASVVTNSNGLSILDKVNGSGIPDQYVYLPNFNAPGLSDSGVTQLYKRSPAPMGIADYGMMEPSGFVIPYEYNTSGFLGTVKFESIKPFYPMNNNPGSISTQLSAVLSGVTINGNSGNDLWIKSVMLYTPATSEVQFISNIWDLSTPGMVFPVNAISSGNGQTVPGLFYHYASPKLTMSGEFTASLYMDAANINGNNAVILKYQFSNTEQNFTSDLVAYDTVVFNSVSSDIQTAANAAFEVNGFKKTASGLLYDAELVVTGPGSGSTTTIYEANGQLTLKFRAADGTPTKLPASYNFGSNTGETIQGLSVWWTSLMKPMAHLSLGPSLLVSLWGSQVSHSGAVNIQGKINPPNSFVFISMGQTFDNSTASWAPVNPNGTYKFSMPGRIDYSGMVILSNYEPFYFKTASAETHNETGEGGEGQPHGGQGGSGEEETAAWQNATLSLSLTRGVYTPLYANGNDQVKYLTVGSSSNGTYAGNGTKDSPYKLENNQYASLNQLFSHSNYFLYPEFSGMQIMNTGASIDVISPPTLHIHYTTDMYWVLDKYKLPLVNSLNMVFYNTSGVKVLDADSISGWFPTTMLHAPAASMMFYGSTDFLIASDTFSGMGASLLVYNNATADTNGTIWGNHFLADHVIHSQYSLNIRGADNPSGVSAYSSGNLIYNNYFTSGISAFSTGVDPYTGNASVVYHNDWNLSGKMPVSYVKHVNGYNLTGSIVDSGYQGGNFWDREITTIPYNSSGGISHGGDYLPLIEITYGVAFNSLGLPSGIPWSVTLDNSARAGTIGTSIDIQVPNGTHVYRIGSPANYSATPVNGTIIMQGNAQELNITFTHMTYPVNFIRSGHPDGLSWGVSMGGKHSTSTSDVITFLCENGSYSYTVDALKNYSADNSSGKLLVYGGEVNESVQFMYALHRITVHVTGLAEGNEWSFTISGERHMSSSSNMSVSRGTGIYSYSITPPDEYAASPSTGTLMVLDEDVVVSVTMQVKTYEVHFVHEGMPSGVPWQVEFANHSFTSTSSVISFTVTSGNYSYTVSPPDGYSAGLKSGSLEVVANDQTVNVQFSKNPDYLGNAALISIGTAVGIVTGLGVSLMVFRRK